MSESRESQAVQQVSWPSNDRKSSRLVYLKLNFIHTRRSLKEISFDGNSFALASENR